MAAYEIKDKEKGTVTIELSEDEELKILNDRPAFMIFKDRLDMAEDLTREQKGHLLELILQDRAGEHIDLEGIKDKHVASVFRFNKKGFDLLDFEYIQATLQRRYNGQKNKKNQIPLDNIVSMR